MLISEMVLRSCKKTWHLLAYVHTPLTFQNYRFPSMGSTNLRIKVSERAIASLLHM